MRLLPLLILPLLQAADQNWPTYGGNPASTRYSPLKQINRTNVARLQPAWTYDTADGPGASQTQPIIIDGVLFGLTPKHKVIALEVTGEQGAQADPSTLRIREPTSHELLRRLALHFQPVRRSAMLVWRTAALRDHAFPALAAGALCGTNLRRARAVALGGVGALLVVSPVLYALAVARHRESFSAFLPAAVFAGIAIALLTAERAPQEVEGAEQRAPAPVGG